MYDMIDRPVTSLGNSGRFLLWALRGWAHALEKGTCPPVALSRGFASVGALQPLPDFHVAMSLLNRQGRDRIALAPLCCTHIVEHEAILMAVFRELALGRIEQARHIVVLLADSDAVSPIVRALTTTTAKLLASGFDLSSLHQKETED